MKEEFKIDRKKLEELTADLISAGYTLKVIGDKNLGVCRIEEEKFRHPYFPAKIILGKKDGDLDTYVQLDKDIKGFYELDIRDIKELTQKYRLPSNESEEKKN